MVVAAGLAWWAVREAKRAARDADAGLARERRAAFQLAALARIGEVAGLRAAGSADALRGLLLTLPEEDLPTLRDFLRAHDDATLPNSGERDLRLHAELRDAVDRRVETPARVWQRPWPLSLFGHQS